jgi:ribosomal protein S18 acetylase RimI-like enzyme
VSVCVRPMTIEDYGDVVALWKSADGIGLSTADERPAIARYLARNPGLSLVATADGRLVGAVLCGHDGRRGYIHHLAVADDCRGRGIGRDLVARCMEALASEGIAKCHIFVYARNTAGRGFWRANGWTLRTDLTVMSRETGPVA